MQEVVRAGAAAARTRPAQVNGWLAKQVGVCWLFRKTAAPGKKHGGWSRVSCEN